MVKMRKTHNRSEGEDVRARGSHTFLDGCKNPLWKDTMALIKLNIADDLAILLLGIYPNYVRNILHCYILKRMKKKGNYPNQLPSIGKWINCDVLIQWDTT